MATLVGKIKDIEEEISRTQINKATMAHLCGLRAKLAKYKRELLFDGTKAGGGGAGEGAPPSCVGGGSAEVPIRPILLDSLRLGNARVCCSAGFCGVSASAGKSGSIGKLETEFNIAGTKARSTDTRSIR